MFGFVIGTICLVALIAMVKHHRRMHGYGGGCGHHGGWGHRGGHGWHGRGRGWGGFGGWRGGPGGFFVRHLSERLDATPGQEKVIAKAIEDVQNAVRDARGELDKTREDVKTAFGADNFDESQVATAFIRQDDEIAKVRKALVGALAEVHGALDERQRKELAELIASFPRGGNGGGRRGWRGRDRDEESGPYRA